jgi:hypothetical protein
MFYPAIRWRALDEDKVGKREIVRRLVSAAVVVAMKEAFMADVATLGAEALRLRTLALGVTNEQALAAIHQFIAELERRAHLADNGKADGS